MWAGRGGAGGRGPTAPLCPAHQLLWTYKKLKNASPNTHKNLFSYKRCPWLRSNKSESKSRGRRPPSLAPPHPVQPRRTEASGWAAGGASQPH